MNKNYNQLKRTKYIKRFGMVSPVEASRIIGIKPCNFSNKNSRMYRYRIKKQIDVDKILQDNEREENFIRTVELLIEYLKHIEDLSYSEMSNSTNICISSIRKLNMDKAKSIVFSVIMIHSKPLMVMRFHKYYNIKITTK